MNAQFLIREAKYLAEQSLAQIKRAEEQIQREKEEKEEGEEPEDVRLNRKYKGMTVRLGVTALGRLPNSKVTSLTRVNVGHVWVKIIRMHHDYGANWFTVELQDTKSTILVLQKDLEL